MKTKDFLYLCVKKGIFIKAYTDTVQRLNTYKAVAKNFDYGCDFKDGICKTYKNSETYKNLNEPNKCCCHSCADHIGYLKTIRVVTFQSLRSISSQSLKSVSKYARLYNIKDGFWRPNKGCVLPYTMRSIKCVTYFCDHVRLKSLNGQEIWKFLMLLSNFNYLSKNEKEELHKLYLKIRNKQKE